MRNRSFHCSLTPPLRLEAIVALTRFGTAQSLRHLIALLGEKSWELRTQAHLALCAMTAQSIPEDEGAWIQWLSSHPPEELSCRILSKVAQMKEPSRQREEELRALRHLASIQSEAQCCDLLNQAHALRLTAYERDLLCEALERIGTTNSIPILARLQSDPATWAIGTIGGLGAESALLQFHKTFAVLLNLDRLRSTNAGSFLPHLVHSFGLVTYRAHPDDLHLPEPQPVQRVAATLILRSGLAPVLIEATLRELEATMAPPVTRDPLLEMPPDLASMLTGMREELKPGFVRGDGETTTQPVVAMYHLVSDASLAQRLRPLLRHPAIVPRIYVAMLLGKLKADEAVPDMVQTIRDGYEFSDATALASGKHFDQSQTVRWRGFLCMALGKIARLAESDPVLLVRSAARDSLRAIRGEPSLTTPRPQLPPAIAFIKTKLRSDATLGFRDSYFFPKTPRYHSGENLYTLAPPRPDGTLKNITRLTDGEVQGPEVSFDGQKILFAMRRNRQTDGFHIFEINIDGTGLRQVTTGNCNDVDPCYLPDGRIAFCSDRARYQEYYHQERSRVLYVMNGDGTDIRQITFNPNQDYEPLVLHDGRIIYSSYRFYAQDGSEGPLPGECMGLGAHRNGVAHPAIRMAQRTTSFTARCVVPFIVRFAPCRSAINSRAGTSVAITWAFQSANSARCPTSRLSAQPPRV